MNSEFGREQCFLCLLLVPIMPRLESTESNGKPKRCMYDITSATVEMELKNISRDTRCKLH